MTFPIALAIALEQVLTCCGPGGEQAVDVRAEQASAVPTKRAVLPAVTWVPARLALKLPAAQATLVIRHVRPGAVPLLRVT